MLKTRAETLLASPKVQEKQLRCLCFLGDVGSDYVATLLALQVMPSYSGSSCWCASSSMVVVDTPTCPRRLLTLAEYRDPLVTRTLLNRCVYDSNCLSLPAHRITFRGDIVEMAMAIPCGLLITRDRAWHHTGAPQNMAPCFINGRYD